MCPIIIHAIESTITIIDFVGVLLNVSIPISSIFCAIAVEVARRIPIGINNRKYFFTTNPISGAVFLIDSIILWVGILLSYHKNNAKMQVVLSTATIHQTPIPARLSYIANPT
jgi:hypothetical protein